MNIRYALQWLAAFSISLAVSPLAAFHADIFLVQQNGTLLTGRGASDPGSGGVPQVGVRFHVNDIAGLVPFVDTNPGFSAEDAADSIFVGNQYQPLPGNRTIGFDLRSFRVADGPAANLFFWNGSGNVVFQPVTNPTDYLEVRSGSLGSALATGSANDITGFDFASTDSTGFLHSHLVFDFDTDNNASTAATTGVYMASFSFNTDLDGNGQREVARPHYMAWFNGPPGTLKTAAMAAVSSFLGSNFAELRLHGDLSPVGDDDLPDDLLDSRDLDALLGAIHTGSLDLLFDLNSDSLINDADLQTLLGLLDSQLGDANLDGLVNAADLADWHSNYGSPGGWADGDFSGNALVDGQDYLLWQRNCTNAADTVGTLVVPEPCTWCLSWLALVLWSASGVSTGCRRRGHTGSHRRHLPGTE
jgi:hypothetical protein